MRQTKNDRSPDGAASRAIRSIGTVILSLTAFVAAVGTMSGCGDTRQNKDLAFLRTLHLSPDAPAVDVFLNGFPTPVVTALPFLSSSAYLGIEQGGYDIAVSATGGSPAQAVLNRALPLLEGQIVTIVAFNNLATIQALVLFDDLSDPGAGMIRVRAVHTAAGVGQVDIYEVSDPGSPTLLAENLDFGSDTGEFELASGTAYTVGLDTNNDAVAELTFAVPALDAGTIANLFAVSSGGDVFLLVQFSNGQTVRIDPEA